MFVFANLLRLQEPNSNSYPVIDDNKNFVKDHGKSVEYSFKRTFIPGC